MRYESCTIRKAESEDRIDLGFYAANEGFCQACDACRDSDGTDEWISDRLSWN